MKKTFFLMIALFTVISALEAQGIRFEDAANWQEILTKAKKENKYIFLDCYATWCGPCKWMDANIYTLDEVGNYFNDRFINVKVQMDRTDADAGKIKQWYNDAKVIENKYTIGAYPTYLFFSPDGEVVHRLVATTKTGAEFISKAKDAFDPTKQYYANVERYKEHAGDSAFLRNAIKVAMKSSDKASASAIGNYYYDCLKDPFAKDNLLVFRDVTTHSSDKAFQLFLKQSEKVNAVFGGKLSEGVVSNIMYTEHIKPYFDTDKPAPDWSQFNKELKRRFPIVSDKAIEQTEVMYYRVKKKIPQYEKAVVSYMKKYASQMGNYELNDYAWTSFLLSDNKELLKEALKWSQSSIDKVEKTTTSNYPNYLDTYANLLYKLGKKDEAIQWQQKALDLISSGKNSKTIAAMTDNLERMKKNEKTW